MTYNPAKSHIVINIKVKSKYLKKFGLLESYSYLCTLIKEKMGIISIDTNFCFECGAPKEEMHHVVPKSKGGKRTLPLCVDCHGKAHDTSHRRLMIDAAKEGRRKYVENGGKLGRKIGSIVNDDEMLLKHVDVIKELENKSSIRKIMKLTQKSSGTVQKVKKIWENKLHTNTLLRTD